MLYESTIRLLLRLTSNRYSDGRCRRHARAALETTIKCGSSHSSTFQQLHAVRAAIPPCQQHAWRDWLKQGVQQRTQGEGMLLSNTARADACPIECAHATLNGTLSHRLPKHTLFASSSICMLYWLRL